MRLVSRLIPLLALCVATMASAVAQQPPPFVREGLQAETLRFESRIRRENEPAGRNLAQLQREAEQAQSRGDLRAATNALAAAIQVEPNNIGLMLRLSDLYRQVNTANDWQLRTELQSRSTAAAYLAYQRSRTPVDQARSLWFLAEAYAARSTWRPALDALRTSLALNDVPAARQRYEALLAEHGFRILDYRVDSDAASPRVCFQFSEPLRARLDATPYVRMPAGIPGAVVADGEQLCVDGLRHGERYDIQIRRGLPSAVVERPCRATPTTRSTCATAPRRCASPDATTCCRASASRASRSSASTCPRSRCRDRAHRRPLDRPDRARRELPRKALGGYEMQQLILRERGTEVWRGHARGGEPPQRGRRHRLPGRTRRSRDRLEPGIYVMFARRADVPAPHRGALAAAGDAMVRRLRSRRDHDPRRSTVVHAEVRSLATAEPVAGAELRLVARNNEVLAHDAHRPRRARPLRARHGARRRRQAPGVLVASRRRRLCRPQSRAAAFDLTDRGVGGRPVPGPARRLPRPERGIYRQRRDGATSPRCCATPRAPPYRTCR
jgi:hypothetical protein